MVQNDGITDAKVIVLLTWSPQPGMCTVIPGLRCVPRTYPKMHISRGAWGRGWSGWREEGRGRRGYSGFWDFSQRDALPLAPPNSVASPKPKKQKQEEAVGWRWFGTFGSARLLSGSEMSSMRSARMYGCVFCLKNVNHKAPVQRRACWTCHRIASANFSMQQESNTHGHEVEHACMGGWARGRA